MEPKAHWTKCTCGCWNNQRKGYYTTQVGPFHLIACANRWGVRQHEVYGTVDSNDVVDQMLGAEQWVRETAQALLKQLS